MVKFIRNNIIRFGFFVFLLVGLILVSGCISPNSNRTYKTNLTSDTQVTNLEDQSASIKEIGFGSLCSGEEGCKTLCLNNRGRCNDYCNSNPENILCQKLFGIEKSNMKTESKSEESNDDQPTLLLKNIGVNLDYYDPTTNRAGDFVFTKSKLSFGLLFFDYGYVIPADKSASGKPKANPQPTFILPQGTKVRSLVDGIVVGVPKLYSGDYSIQVANNMNSKWRYETEHVINPLVKEGDTVTAGQVIAEVSPHSSESNSNFGLVEIGILKGGNPPEHVCPFMYLDPLVKEDVQKKISAFYKSWEEYIGDNNLYNESALTSIGCLSSESIEG